MLQDAYFLAKIGANTAENEQRFAEILPKTGNYPTRGPRRWELRRRRGSRRRRASAGPDLAREILQIFRKIWQIFGGLVLQL